MTLWTRYSYLWITLILFLGSLVGHWVFGWFAYVSEQTQHGAPVEVSGYLVEMMRDTMENWQSEFLQLMWQVGGLAFFLFVGSPQSKEEGDRVEEKMDLILRTLRPVDAEDHIREFDRRFPGRNSGGKM
ncbi:DUF6766 family protein [Tabrizicola sp.]|uniref:DUF6766 family protein n=1 Tax=Tabrizicola sp. TaxID=2005166 RepID=UPI0035AF6F4D